MLACLPTIVQGLAIWWIEIGSLVYEQVAARQGCSQQLNTPLLPACSTQLEELPSSANPKSRAQELEQEPVSLAVASRHALEG